MMNPKNYKLPRLAILISPEFELMDGGQTQVLVHHWTIDGQYFQEAGIMQWAAVIVEVTHGGMLVLAKEKIEPQTVLMVRPDEIRFLSIPNDKDNS